MLADTWMSPPRGICVHSAPAVAARAAMNSNRLAKNFIVKFVVR